VGRRPAPVGTPERPARVGSLGRRPARAGTRERAVLPLAGAQAVKEDRPVRWPIWTVA